MSILTSPFTVLTKGIQSLGSKLSSVLTQGYPQPLKPPVAKSTTAIPVVAEGQPVLPGNLRVAVVPDRPRIYDASGNLINTSSIPSIDLGGGQTLSFDQASLSGVITPALSPTPGHVLENGGQVYTGTDCKVMIEIAESKGPVRFAKQLLETQTRSLPPA